METSFEQWEKGVPGAITGHTLWKIRVYRLALYASELAWADATLLIKDRRGIGLSDQLYRAVGSISANVAEGFGRSSPQDKARFYEYTLGSARESRDWCYKARRILGDSETSLRLDLLTQVVKLLTVMIPDQRSQAVREELEPYDPTEA